MNARLLHVDALIVGDGSTIRDGALVVDATGKVLDVGPSTEVLARSAGVPVTRLRGVLLPGLVNAHTHLELSGLRGKTSPGAGFVPWLESLQAARADELEEERDAAIDRAIAQSMELGVVAVGEVTNTLAAWGRIARHLLGTVFHEVFGLDRTQGLVQVQNLAAMRARMAPGAEGMRRTRYATAPHALYSTHPDVVRALANDTDAPLSFHLAEHAAERAFLHDGRGPFRAFLDAHGLSRAADAFPVPGVGPVAYAGALGLLRKDAALVHLADARPEELDLVARAGAIAVLCPRSNLFIETRLPPLLHRRARGVPIAIGTDSLASTASLDPLAEARALSERTPEVPPSSLVAAATSGSARAIGWGQELGRLRVGTRPGVLHVEGALGGDVDPCAWLLRNTQAPRLRVAIAGRREDA
jgi:cytosine/adenosine deaminase-related metal-dependent hydrolase